MYIDQFGEFVCGYWGLKGSPETTKKPAMIVSPSPTT